MAFKILHGGRVRWSANVDTSAAYTSVNTWEKGEMLALQMDGNSQKVNAAADYQGEYILGFATENRSNASNDKTFASGKVGMVLDESVVYTDEIASGVTNFEENQTLYVDTSGHLTNADPGSGIVVGKSLSALDASGNITAFYSVQY